MWTWGNDTPVWLKPRRTVYFIYRRLGNGDTEYLNDKAGRLRQWRSREAVIAALLKLQPDSPPEAIGFQVSPG